jgi:hypothetical protein
MDRYQPAHPRSLITINAVRFQTLLQWEKLLANSMDRDQTAQLRRLVLVHAGRKTITLVFLMARLKWNLLGVAKNYKTDNNYLFS